MTLGSTKLKIFIETRLQELDAVTAYIAERQEFREQCLHLRKTTDEIRRLNEDDIVSIRKEFRNVWQTQRQLLEEFANTCSKGNWQSPDDNVRYRTSPNQKYNGGGLLGYYRSDGSPELSELETMLNNRTPLPPSGVVKETIATISGMAAFQLALNHALTRSAEAKLVYGKRSYQEIVIQLDYRKDILSQIAWEEELPNAILANKPTIVYLEPLTNTPFVEGKKGITKSPTDKIIEAVIEAKTPTLIIDTSFTGPEFDLKKYFTSLPSFLEIIILRSLQKFDQTGFDLVSGGQIDHYTNSAQNSARLRFIAGGGYLMPSKHIPYFPRLPLSTITKRIERHRLNTETIAASLTDWDVSYADGAPLLYTRNNDVNPGKYYTHSKYIANKTLIALAVEEFEKLTNKGIFVTLGTSFGFNDTAISAGKAIRIAPGVEDHFAINEITEALLAAKQRTRDSHAQIYNEIYFAESLARNGENEGRQRHIQIGKRQLPEPVRTAWKFSGEMIKQMASE